MLAPVHELVTELHRSSRFRSEDPPYVAYDPTVPDGTERALPGAYARASAANSSMLSDLSQIHDLQQHNIRARGRRNAARNAKGKGAGNGKGPPRGKGPDDGPA
eukprot:9358662-Lingulodinium_polyedra.AAC.1